MANPNVDQFGNWIGTHPSGDVENHPADEAAPKRAARVEKEDEKEDEKEADVVATTPLVAATIPTADDGVKTVAPAPPDAKSGRRSAKD